MKRSHRRGQATLEYLLIISVVSIGLGGVILGFTNPFGAAVVDLGDNMADCSLTRQGVQGQNATHGSHCN